MTNTRSRFSPEIGDHAVRMVGEHGADYGSEWQTIVSIGLKIGRTAETTAPLVPRRQAAETVMRLWRPTNGSG